MSFYYENFRQEIVLHKEFRLRSFRYLFLTILIFISMASGPANKDKSISACKLLDSINNYSTKLNNLAVEKESTFSTGAKEIFPPKMQYTDLVSMKNFYFNELKPSVAALIYNGYNPKGMLYLKEQERAAFRLRFGNDGKLYTNEGKLFDTIIAKKIDIEGVEKITGRAIFVMGADGQIYVSNIQEVGHFHHSSFFSGADVIFAGEIEVHDGVIKLINNNSGHYLPPSILLQDLDKYFKSIWGDKTPEYTTEKIVH